MSVLAEIVARKRVDVAARKAFRPLVDVLREARPTTRKLGEALAKPGLRFIFECKKASPSEGLIRPDFDPGAIADVYRDVADAISVLTDSPYFQGSFAHLREVRARVDVPILCKDFVVDPYQVVEARMQGADAVLLMLSVLDDATYRVCAEQAAALNMDVLTEVHDEAELERALALGAAIIGINNRDLKTLRIDLQTTRRLAPRIPKDRIVVCESGIRSRADIDAVSPFVDGFLVGSQLMKAPRLDLAVRELIHGKIKICALTSRAALESAYRAGASMGGLIFAKESPRAISLETAKAMAADSPLPLVGVFVNAPVIAVADHVRELQLTAVQLHGEETAAYIAQLRQRLPETCEIWKAIRVQEGIPLLETFGADRLLLDGFKAGERGGTGVRFDWSLLADYPARERVIVAGGLGPDSVRAAHALGVYALDVNSGVESAPGIKDENQLRRLFAALREEERGE